MPPGKRNEIALNLPDEEAIGNVSYDPGDPHCVFNMLPVVLRTAALAIPAKYWEMEDKHLTKMCFEDGKPHTEARRLRISFWHEYERAVRFEQRKMRFGNVIHGVCTEGWFRNTFMKNEKWFAWILRPPVEYRVTLEDLHHISTKRMEEILALPIERNDKGNWDTSLMKLQKEIHDGITNRIHGAVVQRIAQTLDQKTLSVTATAKEAKNLLGTPASPSTMAEVESRIRQLEKKSTSLQAPSHIETDLMRDVSPPTPEPIEVEYSTDDEEHQNIQGEN